MSLEVYLDPCTVNSRKVLAGLDLLGTKYNYHYINYFEGQHKSPEYSKVNPSKTVPCAKEGDLIITESNAILQHAADEDGQEHTAYPRDRATRSNINRWLLWEASVWFQSCYVYLVEYVVKPLLNAPPDENVIAEQAPRWNELASILDAQLDKTRYIAGDQVTIADIAIAAPMHLHEAAQLPLDKHPNLKRWMADIEKLPSWQKTQGAVDKALLPNKQQQAGAGAQSSSEVRSTLNYTKDLSDKLTELYFYEDSKSLNIHEPGDDAQQVNIKDGWHLADSFSADVNGFSVHSLRPQFSSGWEDDEAVRMDFYPEIVEFLKKTIGAKRVEVFDHTVRSKKNQEKKLTQETNTTQRAPVQLVHCDYTAESAPLRVKQLFPEEADDLLSRRVAFLNVWKPLKKVEEMPLTMCDVKSSPSDDYFKLYLRYRDRTGENYVMRYSPKHQWYYFPQMEADNVILLKTYDSDTNKARFVGHTAFEDPTTKPDAPFRESVEIRTIAFF